MPAPRKIDFKRLETTLAELATTEVGAVLARDDCLSPADLLAHIVAGRPVMCRGRAVFPTPAQRLAAAKAAAPFWPKVAVRRALASVPERRAVAAQELLEARVALVSARRDLRRATTAASRVWDGRSYRRPGPEDQRGIARRLAPHRRRVAMLEAQIAYLEAQTAQEPTPSIDVEAPESL